MPVEIIAKIYCCSCSRTIYTEIPETNIYSQKNAVLLNITKNLGWDQDKCPLCIAKEKKENENK